MCYTCWLVMLGRQAAAAGGPPLGPLPPPEKRNCPKSLQGGRGRFAPALKLAGTRCASHDITEPC